jgi:hypothetical protein
MYASGATSPRDWLTALSLMALQFYANPSPVQMEAAVKCMLDGFVEMGGHWSSGGEAALCTWCRCTRIPKLLVPRHKRKQYGKYWAHRLIDKLDLQ